MTTDCIVPDELRNHSVFCVCFDDYLNSNPNTSKYARCEHHVPGLTRLRKMSKPLMSSKLHFWKQCSGNSGDCDVWKLATVPSPLHSTDGSSAAGISPGKSSAAGLCKAPPESPLTRVPRERGQLLALRSHLSSALVSPSCQRTTVLVRVVTHSAAQV